MAVGRDDGFDPVFPDEVEEGLRLGRGVDEDLLAGLTAPEQVGVVGHRPHGDLGEHQSGQFAHISRATDPHVS